MYLERLKRYDPLLHFVITFTEDRAQAKAKEADREIAAGKYRGPLHGLPWGGEDCSRSPDTARMGAQGGFENQTFDEDATVVKRLDAAGAVLIAKLSLGALAMDDHSFARKRAIPGIRRRVQSGSSAGSASATAAGCVAFSVGSETRGSISSPSTRCGCTGLRPTFGLVPRTGAMALSWSMDKLGPICRSVEDTALVLHAIYGPDGGDRAVQPAAFNWDADLDWRKLRVGFLKADFERPFDNPEERPPKPKSEFSAEEKKKLEEQQQRREQFRLHAEYDRRFDKAAIAKLQAMGVNLIPVELPKFPYDAMATILEAEAAAALDELTRTGRDKLSPIRARHWPQHVPHHATRPAVEYIQANRARMLAMEAVAKTLDGFDVIVAPTNSQQLAVTNLTGHPALILPNGFRGDDAPPPRKNDKGEIEADYGGSGTPVSLTFLGQLYGEGRLLAFARAYQQATDFHLQHPRLSV